MHVLFLDTNTEIGGVVTVLQSVLRHLDRGRTRATVAVQAGGRPERLLTALPDLTLVPCRFGTKPTGLRSSFLSRSYDLLGLPIVLATVLRLAALVLVRRVDVIHTSDKIKSVFVAWLVSVLTGRPLVYHVHAVCVPNRLNRLAMTRATTIVANSHAMKADCVRQLGPEMERIVVLHNGVSLDQPVEGPDLRDELGLPAAAVVVGAASRLAPNKGQADLLRAAARVLRAAPDTWFLLAGDDAIEDDNTGHRQELEALATELGIAERVRFLGFVDDMPRFYRTTDLVVDAAWEEPFGMVVIEPMLFGRPVVGTAAGGIPEIIDPGVNGVLVPPRDPAGLARGLLPLVLDAPARRRLGEQSAELVARRFDAATQAQRLGALLQDAAA